MTNQFCPKCGKETDEFCGKVCKECFVEKQVLMECPLVIPIKTCPTCGSFLRKGKWLFSEDAVENILNCVRDSITIEPQAENVELFLTPKKLHESMYHVGIEMKADINGVEIEAETKTEVRVRKESCLTCNRIAGGYFEGIVQLRAEKRLPTKDELKKGRKIAHDLAGRSQDKGDRLAFISKTLTLDEGIDFYVGSTKLGTQICRAVIEVFGGKYTESPSLVGQKDGVDVYRVTFALRLPEFVRGDIVSVNDRVIEVQIFGKHVRGIDLETGKKIMEPADRIGDIIKLGSASDAVLTVLVTDEGSTIQVLDPETYESVTIKKPEYLSDKAGSEINIIKTKKGIFVLP